MLPTVSDLEGLGAAERPYVRKDAAAVERIRKAASDLGVNAERITSEQAERIYLEQIAYHAAPDATTWRTVLDAGAGLAEGELDERAVVDGGTEQDDEAVAGVGSGHFETWVGAGSREFRGGASRPHPAEWLKAGNRWSWPDRR